MAKYKVETTGGSYLIETEDAPDTTFLKNPIQLNAGPQDQAKVGLTDIATGTYPMKASNYIAEEVKRPLMNMVNQDTADMSNKPILPSNIQTNVAPLTTPFDVGGKLAGLAMPRISGAVTPQNIARGAGEIATDARSYLGLVEGAGALAKIPLKGIGAFINKIGVTSGVPEEEVSRLASEYGTSQGGLVDKIKNMLNTKLEDVDQMYKDAVGKFTGDINTSKFFNTLKKGLQGKGWIDSMGNFTNRYKAGLDPTIDKLAALYDDLKNPVTEEGKKVAGQVMTKEDFLTYRDALNNMIKEKPSDILVMKSKNALFDSAESSGMKGIKAARDAEKEAYGIQDKFLNRKTGDLQVATEGNLSKVGTAKNLTKQQLDHIKELEDYIGHPISQDATNINKINEASRKIKSLKRIGIGALGYEGVHKIVTGRF